MNMIVFQQDTLLTSVCTFLYILIIHIYVKTKDTSDTDSFFFLSYMFMPAPTLTNVASPCGSYMLYLHMFMSSNVSVILLSSIHFVPVVYLNSFRSLFVCSCQISQFNSVNFIQPNITNYKFASEGFAVCTHMDFTSDQEKLPKNRRKPFHGEKGKKPSGGGSLSRMDRINGCHAYRINSITELQHSQFSVLSFLRCECVFSFDFLSIMGAKGLDLIIE